MVAAIILTAAVHALGIYAPNDKDPNLVAMVKQLIPVNVAGVEYTLRRNQFATIRVIVRGQFVPLLARVG